MVEVATGTATVPVAAVAETVQVSLGEVSTAVEIVPPVTAGVVMVGVLRVGEVRVAPEPIVVVPVIAGEVMVGVFTTGEVNDKPESVVAHLTPAVWVLSATNTELLAPTATLIGAPAALAAATEPLAL